MAACNLVRFVFYASVSAIYWYTWMFDTNLYNEGKYKKAGWPHDESFGRRAKFLTYNTMVLFNIFSKFITFESNYQNNDSYSRC